MVLQRLRHRGAPVVRICHLSWEYPPVVYGGLGRHVHAIAREQARAGHEVTVLSHVGIEAEDTVPVTTEETLEGVRIVRVVRDAPHVAFEADTLLGWVAGLNSALARVGMSACVNADVLHAHDWLTAHAASILRTALGVPWVHTIHATEAGRHQGWLPGPLSRSIHSVEGWSAHEADRVIVCSRHMRWEVQRLFDMPDATVIPNGVDVSALLVDVEQREEIRREYGEPLIVHTGRLEWEKGAHTLIEALPRLRRSFPDLQCVLAGRGSQSDALEELARRKRVGGRVHVTGWLPEAQLRALVDAADVAVVPSLYEPFGIVALEAAAVRTPVVAARTGGLVEFLDDDRHGFGFMPGDPASLAQAVRTALGDHVETRRRVDSAFEYVRTRHGWPSIAEQTVAAYESIPRNSDRRGADGRQWSPTAIPSHLNLLHELP